MYYCNLVVVLCRTFELCTYIRTITDKLPFIALVDDLSNPLIVVFITTGVSLIVLSADLRNLKKFYESNLRIAESA